MPMNVVIMAPHFPVYQRHFARGLNWCGANVIGIGDWPWENLDGELKSWLNGGYVRVKAMGDDDEIERAVARIASQVNIDRLEATIELQMLTTARVREKYGIPGPSVETVLLCRDKFRMKRFLKERGIPTGECGEVNTGDDARAFCRAYGYPAVIKPRDMAGAYDTHIVRDAAHLEEVIAKMRIDQERRFITIEEFIDGEEGFYDTLVVNGEIKFEAICNYYPNVLTAMRDRALRPYIVHTNRMDAEENKPVIELGRRVIKELGLQTTGTHMEWFRTKKGIVFGEIGARPAGVRFWDIYCHANQFDIYMEWAKGVVNGEANPRVHRKYSMGLIAIRPNQDGRIQGYTGIEQVRHKLGAYLRELHLPNIGSQAQPIENGYMANGYAHVFHEDYDECRRLLEYVGETVKIHAG